MTEGREVPARVSPPVEQGRGLEVEGSEDRVWRPGGHSRGDHLNIINNIRPHISLQPLLLLLLHLLLLPGVEDDDQSQLAVVSGRTDHLVQEVSGGHHGGSSRSHELSTEAL